MSLPKVTFKDVAVLIPGISGSALAKNGREVWGTSGDRSSGPVRVNEASGLPNINVQRAAEALAFHQEIQAAQQTNSTIEEYRTTGYTIFPIVGIEQATFQSAVFDNGKLELRRELSGKDRAGDGTVPRPSATPLELSAKRREQFVAEQHASLLNLVRPDRGDWRVDRRRYRLADL